MLMMPCYDQHDSNDEKPKRGKNDSSPHVNIINKFASTLFKLLKLVRPSIHLPIKIQALHFINFPQFFNFSRYSPRVNYYSRLSNSSRFVCICSPAAHWLTGWLAHSAIFFAIIVSQTVSHISQQQASLVIAAACESSRHRHR